MKKTFAVILLVMMMLSAVGCQQTPETSIVVGKNNDALVEKAQAYLEAENESIGERLGLASDPTNFQASFASTDGSISVSVDAEIVAPDADTVAIIRVSNGTISQEQADILIEELVHTTLYDPYAPTTKDAIMQKILDAKQQLDAGPTEDNEGFTYFDANGNEMAWEQWMQQTIDRLYEEYATAPEDDTAAQISGLFEEEDGGLSLIYGTGSSEEYGYEELQIQNGQGLGSSRALYARNEYIDSFYTLDNYKSAEELTDQYLPDISITETEAQSLSDKLVSKLDIEGMTFYSAGKRYCGENALDPTSTKCYWVLQYTRSFGGLPITYTSATGDMMTDAAVYNEPWPYETLVFFVNDDGIVGLWWEAPYVIEDIVTDDSALLSFSDIMDVFEKMYLVDNDGRNIDVMVNEIRLGYTRIAEQDQDGRGLLVPVWDFFGTITDAEGNLTDDPERSLLTINAIDGSIINRDLGY